MLASIESYNCKEHDGVVAAPSIPDSLVSASSVPLTSLHKIMFTSKFGLLHNEYTKSKTTIPELSFTMQRLRRNLATDELREEWLVSTATTTTTTTTTATTATTTTTTTTTTTKEAETNVSQFIPSGTTIATMSGGTRILSASSLLSSATSSLSCSRHPSGRESKLWGSLINGQSARLSAQPQTIKSQVLLLEKLLLCPNTSN